MNNPKRIAIITPIYNESANIPLLLKELHEHTDKLPYDFEFILVDDGSQDNSARVIRELAKTDKQIHYLGFSRNFGKEAAVAAGIHAVTGDAALIMDADLQHPPELIGEFIKKWEEGFEVVVGVRTYDKNETWFKKKASVWFYRIMQKISHTQITAHATDFRLIDRCVINEFNRFTERNRMNRGLIDWLGFTRGYIHFTARLRQHGEAGYSLSKLVGLAINSLTAYSLTPLRLAGYFGVFILATSGPLGLFVFTQQYILDDPLGLNIRATAILALLTIFLVGIVLSALGLVALYIAHIYDEVANRPLYVLRPTPREDE